jgi:hypothetical protein
MKDVLKREWFPWEAQGEGLINSALCKHTQDPYPNMRTDEWDSPTVRYEEWGAAKNFSHDLLFAVAREADRRELTRKPYSLVMAYIHLVRQWKMDDNIDQYFVIDGERIDVNEPEFKERYLQVPENMDYERSDWYCRNCPRKMNICEQEKEAQVVLRPLPKRTHPDPTIDYYQLAWCVSRTGNKNTKHGDCMLPSFSVFNNK